MAPDSPSPGRGVVATVPHEESGPVATRTAPNINTNVTARVPAHPRGGDPRRRHRLHQMFGRRTVSRELDDLLGVNRPVNNVSDMGSYRDWYHDCGLDLGYEERVRAGRDADGWWCA